MSIAVTVQPAQVVMLDGIKVLSVRDLFEEKKIVARIAGLPRPLLLWSGDEEYKEAGVWTNETALARAREILSITPVRFAN